MVVVRDKGRRLPSSTCIKSFWSIKQAFGDTFDIIHIFKHAVFSLATCASWCDLFYSTFVADCRLHQPSEAYRISGGRSDLVVPPNDVWLTPTCTKTKKQQDQRHIAEGIHDYRVTSVSAAYCSVRCHDTKGHYQSDIGFKTKHIVEAN